MANKKDNNYTDILLEDIRDQNRAVLEAVGAMQDHVKLSPNISERLEKLEYDMAAVRIATRVTNDSIKLIKIRTEKLEEHETRITKLEQKAA